MTPETRKIKRFLSRCKTQKAILQGLLKIGGRAKNRGAIGMRYDAGQLEYLSAGDGSLLQPVYELRGKKLIVEKFDNARMVFGDRIGHYQLTYRGRLIAEALAA